MAPVERNSKSLSGDDPELIDLPQREEEIHGNTKIVTEYEINDAGKLEKVISTYRLERKKVPKIVAERKKLKKFGLSANDPPGPNPATTVIGEEVFMQFLTSVEEEDNEVDDMKKKLKDSTKGQVKCRLCKEDHWTTMCPYKDQLKPLTSGLMGEEEEEDGPKKESSGPSKALASAGGKYVPPSMREGANKRGESMNMRTRDETTTVRVTNLSENTKEDDLQSLFHPYGDIVRIYLAKDKVTGVSKGFAFINYKRREEAESAIRSLDGHGYDHLILNVEWAKPSA